jgi:hypothetical protein
VPAPGDGFEHDELQKPFQPIALLKRGAGEDPLEMLPDAIVDLRLGGSGCG